MKSCVQMPRRFNVTVRVCCCAFFLALMLASLSTVSAQMKPGDIRKAYGEPRASIMESLLQTLYPGSVVQWDPYFMVQLPGESLRNLDLPVYVFASPTGGLQGVATIEFDKQKDRFIFEAQNFRRSDAPNFPTDLIFFRADRAGHILTYKKVPLDPDESLTELKIVTLKDWSHEWPTIEIEYQTHRPTPSSFTTIEWRATFDAGSGQFISRLPAAIDRFNRGGAEQMFMFGLGRINSRTIEVVDRLTRQSHQFDCSDPCVLEADTLLAKWNLDAPTGPSGASAPSAPPNFGPTTIRLKNGRTIHADSAVENGEKIEYTVGESTFKIPRSSINEITHSSAPAAATGPQAAPGLQISSSPQTSRSDCPKQGDPNIPCRSTFFIQVLMGLGETQRFKLIDDANHDVTAQANWVISDVADQADFSVVNGVPRVYSKAFGTNNQGMVQLYATVGDYTAMARIYIVTPEVIATTKGGRWVTPNFPKNPQLILIPAAPIIGHMQ